MSTEETLDFFDHHEAMIELLPKKIKPLFQQKELESPEERAIGFEYLKLHT